MPRPINTSIVEGLLAVALLAIGLLAVALAWTMPSGSIAQPGPRVFPTAIGAALAVTALAGLIGAVRHRQQAGVVAFGHRDALVTLAMLFFAAFAFERIGAAATFTIFLCVLLRSLARLAWWQAAGASLLGAAVAWSVFTLLLGVRLPGAPF